MPATEVKISGDKAEFEKLFKDFYAPLTLFVAGIVNDRDQAEEIVQDLFYNLWINREKIFIQTSLKSYLYQGARNRALKLIRHDAVKQKYAAAILESNNDSADFDYLNVMEMKELEIRVKNILDQLPPETAQVFKMNRFEGMKYREIAEKLSISVKTVEARMSRALAGFRQHLKDYTTPKI